MKKLFSIILFSVIFSLFAQDNKYLYTIELSPENLADIDPRQNIVLQDIEGRKKAVVVKKNDSSWMDLTLEECLGKEIVVTFRYKAAVNGKFSKKAWAHLRYAKGDVYCDGPTGKSLKLTIGNEWKSASCSMKFPAEMEEAMIFFGNGGEDFLVTDIKVYRKNKVEK